MQIRSKRASETKTASTPSMTVSSNQLKFRVKVHLQTTCCCCQWRCWLLLLGAGLVASCWRIDGESFAEKSCGFSRGGWLWFELKCFKIICFKPTEKNVRKCSHFSIVMINLVIFTPPKCYTTHISIRAENFNKRNKQLTNSCLARNCQHHWHCY